MIVIAGALYVDPPDRARYLELTYEVAVLARGAPGCLDFVQAADPIDASRINIFERWDDDGDVAAFRTSGSDGDGDVDESPPILRAEVSKYRIGAVEAP